jgi:hypothetical protein
VPPDQQTRGVLPARRDLFLAGRNVLVQAVDVERVRLCRSSCEASSPIPGRDVVVRAGQCPLDPRIYLGGILPLRSTSPTVERGGNIMLVVRPSEAKSVWALSFGSLPEVGFVGGTWDIWDLGSKSTLGL